MKSEEGLLRQLEQVASEICDRYCKWPEKYYSEQTDEAYERLCKDHCDDCPIMRM